jgi:SAM-dependent methyltransferase
MDKAKYSWEQTVILLRQNPDHRDLIRDSYLGADLDDNCRRFLLSDEFKETLSLMETEAPAAKDILDLPAGNGIACYAFAKKGYSVVAVEPDASATVGRGAIELIKKAHNLGTIEIVDAWGENLPFPAESFDVVYVRQGLHHAKDLRKMVSELIRVLRKGGLMVAVREHVVDDYAESLESFLASQPDHQLYGGENAFTLEDYKKAIQAAGFKMIRCLGPYDSIINLYPESPSRLRKQLLSSRRARMLKKIVGEEIVFKLALSKLKKTAYPGRLYSFFARKSRSSRENTR